MEYAPSAALKPYVKSYRIVSSEHGQVNRVLPATGCAVAFRLSGEISYRTADGLVPLPSCAVTGAGKAVRLIRYEHNTTAIIVQFADTGGASFFRGLHTLSGQSVGLDGFFKQSEIQQVEEKLAEAKDHAERIRVIESFLLSKLTRQNPDLLIAETIAAIYSSRGNLSIKTLLSQFAISRDAFEKRFRSQTGSTPKNFSHTVKMNFVIRQNRMNPSFLDMAFENGFYDQPHFNKDFKVFTGLTPTAFFRSGPFW